MKRKKIVLILIGMGKREIFCKKENNTDYVKK